MELIFSKRALKERDYWKKSGNKAIIKRITLLLNDIMAHPFEGIGKPELLKYREGVWSRRITSEHRLVYEVDGDMIKVLILSMRYHYDK